MVYAVFLESQIYSLKFCLCADGVLCGHVQPLLCFGRCNCRGGAGAGMDTDIRNQQPDVRESYARATFHLSLMTVTGA